MKLNGEVIGSDWYLVFYFKGFWMMGNDINLVKYKMICNIWIIFWVFLNCCFGLEYKMVICYVKFYNYIICKIKCI